MKQERFLFIAFYHFSITYKVKSSCFAFLESVSFLMFIGPPISWGFCRFLTCSLCSLSRAEPILVPDLSRTIRINSHWFRVGKKVSERPIHVMCSIWSQINVINLGKDTLSAGDVLRKNYKSEVTSGLATGIKTVTKRS